jgi:hypothetical protein
MTESVVVSNYLESKAKEEKKSRGERERAGLYI